VLSVYARVVYRDCGFFSLIQVLVGISHPMLRPSCRMGTSVELIDRTYGHLAPDAEEYERGLLDAYDAKTDAFGHLSGIQGAG
jgi:hypothetical protein